MAVHSCKRCDLEGWKHGHARMTAIIMPYIERLQNSIFLICTRIIHYHKSDTEHAQVTS